MRISDGSSDVCSADLEHAHRAQVVELADRHVLLPHLLPDAVDVLGPAGDLGIDALRRQRIAQGRGDLGDVAFAAGALVVEQARDAAVGVRVEMRSEEHTSELQSLMRISYAVFCLK